MLFSGRHCIQDVLRENFKNHADRVFCTLLFSHESQVFTYHDLEKHARHFSKHYKKYDAVEKDTILIVLDHSKDLICSFVGALLIGAIPTILAPPSEKQHESLYQTSLQKLAERISAKILITSEGLRESLWRVEESGTRLLTCEDMDDLDSEYVYAAVQATDIAILQHSSGTTGLKKGVALSHQSIFNQINNYVSALQLNDDDRIVSWLPLYHDMGFIACFVMPLLTRIPIVMMDPFDWIKRPEMLFEAIEKYQGTICWLPNFAFNCLSLIVRENYDLSSMRAFINCSEPCKAQTFDLFKQHFGVADSVLHTCYAMAENVFAVTQSPLGAAVTREAIDLTTFIEEQRAQCSTSDDALHMLSVGRVIDNNAIRIVDERRNILPERTVGEVAISGDSLFNEYYKLPDITAEVLVSGWYYTGDLGYLADGELYITGRKKDLIIVCGKNYYAHDIEELVNLVDGVKKGRTVAIDIFDERFASEEVVVIAETLLDDDDKKVQLRKAIKSVVNLNLNLLVKDIYLVPLTWLVKTTSGKISRAGNKKKYLAEKAEESDG